MYRVNTLKVALDSSEEKTLSLHNYYVESKS